ncbi:hypothetical protein KI387_028505, partial [Taxus chinensis]
EPFWCATCNHLHDPFSRADGMLNQALIAQGMILQLSAIEAPSQGDSTKAPKPPEANLINWQQEDQHGSITRVYKRRAVRDPTKNFLDFDVIASLAYGFFHRDIAWVDDLSRY